MRRRLSRRLLRWVFFMKLRLGRKSCCLLVFCHWHAGDGCVRGAHMAVAECAHGLPFDFFVVDSARRRETESRCIGLDIRSIRPGLFPFILRN